MHEAIPVGKQLCHVGYLIVAQVLLVSQTTLGLQSLLYIEANIEIQFRAIGRQYKKIASTDSFKSELE